MALPEMMLKVEDAKGILPLLLMVSGFAAQERGSETIEPRDLAKAIYVVDLEHVLAYWDNWEGFERLVCSETLVEIDGPPTYMNRVLYMIRLDRVWRGGSGLKPVGTPSQMLKNVVNAAREVAFDRDGSGGTPKSKDLLYCICSKDAKLRDALERSGLRLDKLKSAISVLPGCGPK